MTEQKIKTEEEIYSRDGIMIYQNGFRIAECENEEAADQILQALSQFSSPQEVTEITEEEIRSVGAARSQSMPSLMAASGFLNGFKEGAKWMREKLSVNVKK